VDDFLVHVKIKFLYVNRRLINLSYVGYSQKSLAVIC
jgi:hypothetical protein